LQSITYGVQHEKDGIDYLRKSKGITVEATGLHLAKCGYLGGSPDGLVGVNKLIEVKCPFSLREKSFEDALKHPNCCLYRNGTGDLELKRAHNYYHQVQGCLHLTGRESCHFVYWTQLWQANVEVKRDMQWEQNIDLLHKFYKDIYLPFLIAKQELSNCVGNPSLSWKQNKNKLFTFLIKFSLSCAFCFHISEMRYNTIA
jgi:hypothetical protein